MKLKYKLSLFLFFMEVIVLNSLKSNGIKIESTFGSLSVMILFFLPL